MEVFRAYRVVLDPNGEQEQACARHAGAARWGYNWALAQKIAALHAYQAAIAELTYTTYADLGPDAALVAATAQVKASKAHKIPGAFTLSSLYTKVKGDEREGKDGCAPWWHTVNRRAIIGGFKNADAAWKNWVDSRTGKRAGGRVGFPRFKKRGRSHDSWTVEHDRSRPTIRVEDPRHLRIPNLGVVRCASNMRRLWRRIHHKRAEITSVTVSRHGRRWIASVLVVEQMPDPVTTGRQRGAGTVGIDLGVRHLATMSTGETITNPRHVRDNAARLATAQRKLARSKKGSNNRAKQARKVADLHARLAERRASHLHQITKRWATGWETIAIEDLNVAGMTRSARGTLEQPGRNVKQKSGLNREILDVSFGEIRRQLEYKTGWYGSKLAVVDRWAPTSKTCSGCGTVVASLSLGQRTFRCPACGLVLDRDHNAAINIAALGRTAVSTKPKPSLRDDAATSTTPATSDEGDARGENRAACREPAAPRDDRTVDAGRPPHQGSVTPARAIARGSLHPPSALLPAQDNP